MPTTTPFNNLITFSRGSNATVTGSNGLIQWAPNNLLLQSESFDAAAWTKTAATVTANAVIAPDGTTTADRLVPTAVSSLHFAEQTATVVATQYTMSVYAKADGYNFVAVGERTGTGWAYFDLNNGTIGNINGGAVPVITSVGNGWYRCSVTFTSAGGSRGGFVLCDSTNGSLSSWTGNGTSGIFIWGAQLELGSTATTYNPTTVKNLLGFSEAFDNAAWTKVQTSIVTGAQANPVNGLFNAQKLMENTASGEHRTFFTIITAPNTYTYSVYLKAAERTFASLIHLTVSPQPSIVVNLTTGAITSPTNVTASGAVNVGNGWWRVWMTYTTTTSTTSYPQVMVFSNATTGNYVGDGNSGVYIYGAQLSDSASLDPYVPTPGAAPSSTAFYGPRFDFDPVTRAPRGLLVEEQRTNLALYSEDFTNAAWTKENATATANATAAPDGATTADRLNASAGAGVHSTYTATAITVATGTNAASTIYVKKGTHRFVYMTQSVSVAHNFTAIFDLDGGGSTATQTGVGSLSGTIASTSQTDVGNGWFRLSVTGSATGASRFVAVGFAQAATGNTIDNVGNVTYTAAGTETIFIWGAQLEAGAFATSYIPTVASTVTRSADVATITGQNFAQWYGQTQGSFVASVGLLASFNFPVPFMAADSAAATTKRIQIYLSGTAPTYRVTDGTDQAAINTAAVTIPSVSNFATAYQANNFAATVNGAAVATDSSGTVPAVNTFYIGNQASTQFINGHIRNIRFIPARAADFQLQGLST